MKKFILILLLFFVQASGTFASGLIDKSFKIDKDTNLVAVQIVDGVSDGCWTNLLESKNYAGDKLKLLGVNIISIQDFIPLATDKTYVFNIYVQGRRYGDVCFGAIRISLFTSAFFNGKIHIAEIISKSWSTVNRPNLNNDILQAISTIIKDFK